VKSWPRDADVVRKVVKIEKSYGNPSGKTVAVGIDITAFLVSL
jgi:hypothetical protein